MTRNICCICWPNDEKFPKFDRPITLFYSKIFFGKSFPAVLTFVQFISACVGCFSLRTLWRSSANLILCFIQIRQHKKHTVNGVWLATVLQRKILFIRGFKMCVLSSAQNEWHKDTSWWTLAWTVAAAGSVAHLSKRHNCVENLESTRNKTSKFLIWTQKLPSSNACSNN